MQELQVTLKERNIDICSLNETFLNSKIKVDIPGYHLIRKDRSTGKGGGVAFLIKSDIKFEELVLNIQNKINNIEYKGIVINNKKIKDLIVSTYYSPRGHTYKELLSNLRILSDNMILLGDFNAKHTSLGSSTSNYLGKKMVDIINNNNFYNVTNQGYTRYDATNDSFDIIDFVFVTQNLISITSLISTEMDIPSDHLSLYFELELENSRESERDINVKSYHKADWNFINQKIKRKMDMIQPIFDLLKYKSSVQKQEIIDYAAEKLQNIIYTVLESNILTTKIKNKNSGLPPNIVSKIKEKRKFRREFTKTKDILLKIKLNKLKKEIKNEINIERDIQWEKKF